MKKESKTIKTPENLIHTTYKNNQFTGEMVFSEKGISYDWHNRNSFTGFPIGYS